jgi:hypothetical protein
MSIGVEVQIDMPAERRDHRDHALEHALSGHAAEMSHEIEAAAAKPPSCKLTQAPLGDAARRDLATAPIGAA